MSEVGLGDLHDEVHPSAAGYELFAQIWGEAILEATDRAGGTLNGEVAAVGPEVAEVVGSEAGDRLLGDGTNDILSGMGGNDWIDGRGGADVLSGGAGRDVFAFGPGSGQDRILDFTTGAEGDLLLLAGAGLTTLSELEGRLSQRDGGLDLDLDSGDVVHLVGLAPGDLEDGNLIFA